MSRKVYKIKELDLLERWGYKYIASVASNYFATTYYKVRAINDLRMCSGVVKDCPLVITPDTSINWADTALSLNVGEIINNLLKVEGELSGLEKV